MCLFVLFVRLLVVLAPLVSLYELVQLLVLVTRSPTAVVLHRSSLDTASQWFYREDLKVFCEQLQTDDLMIGTG